MNTDFLDEESYTIRALAKRYKVAYQTVEKWVNQGLFNKPNCITVYKLPDHKETRITQTGVNYFNDQITIIGGRK